MTDKVDINNFMGVIGATIDTEDGIVFPGENMISGNAVTSAGVTKAQLMTDKGLATQWFESIKATYEREETERDHAASVRNVPELSFVGGDTTPAESGGDARTEAAASQTLEEELQARQERWASIMERAVASQQAADAQFAEALAQLKKIEAALDAIRGL